LVVSNICAFVALPRIFGPVEDEINWEQPVAKAAENSDEDLSEAGEDTNDDVSRWAEDMDDVS
jgi:hypothetical protein